jgi:hypothetical protein
MPSLNATPEAIESRIRTVLKKIDPRTLSQHKSLPELENELLRLTSLPAFQNALLSGNRLCWFVVSSLEAAHEKAFLCFCGMGMPLEKIIALLMSLKPACPAPSSWRHGYIKLFAAIASYRWKPASLAMALNQVENKSDISAVSLRIVLKHAYRSKTLLDLVMALRTYLPQLNNSLESAISGFLTEVENQRLDISALPRELFVPHHLYAGRLNAPYCTDTRQLLWDTSLSYDSRVELGRLGMPWAQCDLARKLGWGTLQDVISYIADLHKQVGQGLLFSTLMAKTPELALAKAAFHQNQTSVDHLTSLHHDLCQALFETGFVRGSCTAHGTIENTKPVSRSMPNSPAFLERVPIAL